MFKDQYYYYYAEPFGFQSSDVTFPALMPLNLVNMHSVFIQDYVNKFRQLENFNMVINIQYLISDIRILDFFYNFLISLARNKYACFTPPSQDPDLLIHNQKTPNFIKLGDIYKIELVGNFKDLKCNIYVYTHKKVFLIMPKILFSIVSNNVGEGYELEVNSTTPYDIPCISVSFPQNENKEILLETEQSKYVKNLKEYFSISDKLLTGKESLSKVPSDKFSIFMNIACFIILHKDNLIVAFRKTPDIKDGYNQYKVVPLKISLVKHKGKFKTFLEFTKGKDKIIYKAIIKIGSAKSNDNILYETTCKSNIVCNNASKNISFITIDLKKEESFS